MIYIIFMQFLSIYSSVCLHKFCPIVHGCLFVQIRWIYLGVNWNKWLMFSKRLNSKLQIFSLFDLLNVASQLTSPYFKCNNDPSTNAHICIVEVINIDHVFYQPLLKITFNMIDHETIHLHHDNFFTYCRYNNAAHAYNALNVYLIIHTNWTPVIIFVSIRFPSQQI